MGATRGNRLLNRIVNVEDPSSSIRMRGRALNLLLVALSGAAVPIVLLSFVLSRTEGLFVILLESGTILPAYLFAKLGWVRLATMYFIAAFSVGIGAAAFGAIPYPGGEQALVDCSTGLLFTIVVTSLLMRYWSGLIVGALNSVLIVAMYLDWSFYHPQPLFSDGLLTLLAAPILNQVWMMLACTLIARGTNNIYRRFERVLEALPVGIAVYNPEAGELITNKQLKTILGPLSPGSYSKIGRVRSLLKLDRLESPAAPGADLPWERAAASATPLASPTQAKLIHPDGRVVHIEENIAYIKNEAGAVREIAYVVTDMSLFRALQGRLETLLEERFEEAKQHQAKADERLVELDRLKAEFLSLMSHELKTPLGAILNYADWLLNESDAPLTEKQAHDVRAIHVAGHHLHEVFNSILDVGKIDSGHLILSRKVIDVRDTIREISETMRGQADRKGLSLILMLPDQPVWIDADPFRIRQVLINLLSNAIKFTAHGSIRVSLVTTIAEVQISVQDTGVGIALDQQASIFKWFYQVDRGAQQSGTGLGLTIAQSLVNLHGGQMSVESTPGHGSTFRVGLPLANPAH